MLEKLFLKVLTYPRIINCIGVEGFDSFIVELNKSGFECRKHIHLWAERSRYLSGGAPTLAAPSTAMAFSGVEPKEAKAEDFKQGEHDR